MRLRTFGTTADGRAVHAALLGWPGGLSVEVLDYGATLHRIRTPTPAGPRDMILSLDTLEDYERGDAYVGALVGRVANRIGAGRFPLDGREVLVSVNEPPNTLHGGEVGWNRRVWRFGATDERSAELTYHSPDGEEGFPGEVEASVRLAVVAADTLEIAYEARAARPTPVNLSHHLYFNLLGDRSTTILDHRLRIAADATTPVSGPELIPSGEIAPVADGPLDLRTGARVGDLVDLRDPQIAFAGGLDFNWALSGPAGAAALRLEAPGGAWMELSTDQVGVQVYSGHKLTAPFPRYGGLAVEPQGFPDAVNHPDFPSQVLLPGDVYRRTSRYRFGA